MPTTTRFSGSKIRQARHEAGMTQAALAHAAGTRERNIIRWENDQHSPRFEHVAAIARATGKDIAFFAADEPSGEEEDEGEQPVFRFLVPVEVPVGMLDYDLLAEAIKRREQEQVA